MLFVLVMGFVSGIPLYLVLSTITIWLTEGGVALGAIGLFAVVGLPWNLKFIWAPMMDSYAAPGLGQFLGRRKSWMVLAQLGLMAAIATLAMLDPLRDIWLAGFVALAIAFFSASQDIVIDAYRIAILDPEEQGAGAAATQTGYRLGGLVSGAGALFLADFFSWDVTFLLMTGTILAGVIAALLAPVPEGDLDPAPRADSFWGRLGMAVTTPFSAFIHRHGLRATALILVFILLYKFGDSFAGVMANAFYVKIGFTKSEIATASKIFGVFATLFGVFIGGVLVFRWGVMPALVFCGFLQMFSNVMFVLQAEVGARIDLLFVTIGVENLSGGMGSAAFVAYLSLLCEKKFAGTQFALLSSIMALGRTLLSTPSGFLAEFLGWSPFFALTVLAALPGVIMAIWMMRHMPLSVSPRRQSSL